MNITDFKLNQPAFIYDTIYHNIKKTHIVEINDKFVVTINGMHFISTDYRKMYLQCNTPLEHNLLFGNMEDFENYRLNLWRRRLSVRRNTMMQWKGY